MELAALEQSLKKDGVAPIWLVHGEELWMIEQATRMIVTAAVGRYDDPMTVARVDLAEGKKGAKDILAACRSIGLFTSKIAVVVRAAELLDKKSEDKEELAKYAEKPVREATLVLKASEQLDGRSAFIKRVQKHGKVLSYPLLKGWQAEKWVSERARQIGSRCDQETAKLIVDLVGSSLMALEQTLQQLSLYAGAGKPILRTDVEGALAATRSHSIFELVDAISERNARQAIRHVDAMIEQREYPPQILGMIVRHFRQLVDAKAIADGGGGAQDIQAKLKLHEFVAKKLADQVHRFESAFLRHSFEEFFRAELELKSSRIDPALRLESLLMRLCQPQGPSARRAR
jgi:DNA polymerase-3 subunit delta